MTFVIQNEGLWAAIEATYRTGEAIVAGDAIEIRKLVANPTDSIKIVERQIIRNSLAPDVHQYGASLFGFSFDVELKGSGTAGIAPRVGPLLRACALKETIVASTSVTYEPESDIDQHDSVTIWMKEGPNLRKVTGCRGVCTGAVDSGGELLLSFTMTGHIDSEAAAAAPAQTFETTKPPVFKNIAFTAAAVATPIGKLAFDLGNTLAIAPDPNQSNSFGVIRVTARKVAGSFDPEAQSIATQDPIGDLRAATELVVATGVVGPTAGNKYAINFPRAQYMNVAPGDRDGVRIYENSFAAYPTTSGDDDIAIALT